MKWPMERQYSNKWVETMVPAAILSVILPNVTARSLKGVRLFKTLKLFFLKSCSNLCMDILDFAIEIEYSAYDLYKTMAEQSEQEKTQAMFFSLAQAEKVHLEQMINALELCA